MYFVSVTKHKDRPVVKVDGKNKNIEYFPLTKAGCIAAGQWLYIEKQETWMNSSSVDFPKEVHPSFRHDVRELMDQGYNQALKKYTNEPVLHRSVDEYEIYGNQFVAIAINRNNPEDSHQFTIDPDVNNDAFIRACGWAG